jgi:pSer/pThr/pTyr-binding forkhead associated (FHA) protein
MKLIVEESGKRVTYDLDGSEVTIGRGLENTIPIRDPLASRRHLKLEQQEGRVTARDLGSRNGTQINGAPLREVTLSRGDCLKIGATCVFFEARPSEETAATPPGGTAAPPAKRAEPSAAQSTDPAEAVTQLRPIPILDDDDDDLDALVDELAAEMNALDRAQGGPNDETADVGDATLNRAAASSCACSPFAWGAARRTTSR